MKRNILLLLVGVIVCFVAINKGTGGALAGLAPGFCATVFIVLAIKNIRQEILRRRRTKWMVRRAFAKACLDEANLSILTEDVRVYLVSDSEEEVDAYGCLVVNARGNAEGKVYVDKFGQSISVVIDILMRGWKYYFPQIYVEYSNRNEL